MTTDITELAQSLKAAAENAIGAHERLAAYPYGEIIDISQHEGEQIDIDITDLNEFNKEANPVNILALVEALEKAQKHIARQEQIILNQDESLSIRRSELEKAQSQSSKWLEAYHKAVSVGARYEERIAELESRTVTIEPFRSFVTDADLAALHRFAECCDDPESGGHDLRKEQVRRLEAIGALQRSGRISYITGFGDVLISITAGIKVETDSVDSDVSDRNQPGMVVAVHIDVGDFVKFRDQVYEVKETDFDDHDVTLWFVGGEALKCAAGCQLEVVSAPEEDE
ncbi:ead/Ea22-like family protein [Klebsiella oxytoca]|uniref:ead/Ea22-like family protein n=1 Tax=Klebsiella oxytoca TaxID=571 RepID=UPI002594C379|nr:ead/Ea22-like family protein [Klebsiella oxytoca]MDM4106131.1 ead/Ea22-like family protein [Klebsiella oxytoca]